MPIEKIGGEPSRVEDNERERDDQLQAKKAFGMVLDDLVKKEVIDKRFALTLLRAEKYGEIGEVMIGLSENLGMLQGRVEDGEMEREEADGIREELIREASKRATAYVRRDKAIKSFVEKGYLNPEEARKYEEMDVLVADERLSSRGALEIAVRGLVEDGVINERFAFVLLRAEEIGFTETVIGLSENLGLLQGRVEDGEMEREEADGIRKRLIEEALDKVSAHVIKDTLLKSLAERRHLNRSEKVVAIGEIMIGLSEELGLLQGQVEDVKIKNEEAD